MFTLKGQKRTLTAVSALKSLRKSHCWCRWFCSHVAFCEQETKAEYKYLCLLHGPTVMLLMNCYIRNKFCLNQKLNIVDRVRQSRHCAAFQKKHQTHQHYEWVHAYEDMKNGAGYSRTDKESTHPTPTTTTSKQTKQQQKTTEQQQPQTNKTNKQPQQTNSETQLNSP